MYASVSPLPPHLRPLTTATGQAYQRDFDRDVPLTPQPIPTPPHDTHEATQGAPYRLFDAMSFREEEEPALVDYYRAMERAAEQTHRGALALVRIDRVEGDYEISAEIMQRIDACDALLADFTLSPRNVYFEIGYARGRDKRIIQTARLEHGLGVRCSQLEGDLLPERHRA